MPTIAGTKGLEILSLVCAGILLGQAQSTAVWQEDSKIESAVHLPSLS